MKAIDFVDLDLLLLKMSTNFGIRVKHLELIQCPTTKSHMWCFSRILFGCFLIFALYYQFCQRPLFVDDILLMMSNRSIESLQTNSNLELKNFNRQLTLQLSRYAGYRLRS